MEREHKYARRRIMPPPKSLPAGKKPCKNCRRQKTAGGKKRCTWYERVFCGAAALPAAPPHKKLNGGHLLFLSFLFLQAPHPPHAGQLPQSQPMCPPFAFLYIIQATTPSTASPTTTIVTISKAPIICLKYPNFQMRVYALLRSLGNLMTPLFLSTVSATAAAMTASQMNAVHHHESTV